MSCWCLRISLTATVLLTAACSENDEQCSTLPSKVYSVTVFDEVAPLAGVQQLMVETTGSGVLDLTVMAEPWAGQDEFQFPYRLNPILANQAGAAVTVTAYDENFEVIGAGTGTLPWRDDGTECVASVNADGIVELELE